MKNTNNCIIDKCNKEYIKITYTITEKNEEPYSIFRVIVIKNIMSIDYIPSKNIVKIDSNEIVFINRITAKDFYIKVFGYICPQTAKSIKPKDAKTKSFEVIKNDFINFYKEQYDTDFYLDIKEIKALKEIETKLIFLSKDSVEDVNDLFKVFVTTSYGIFKSDKFLKDKFKPTMINNQYNTIILKIKEKNKENEEATSIIDNF